MKKNLLWIALALLLLAGMIGTTWWFLHARAEAAHGQAKAEPKAVLTVAWVQAQPERLTVRLPASGSVAAWQEALVGAEISGLRLTQVRAEVGDQVRRGQVLAELSSDTLRAELAQLQAQKQEAEALWQDAHANAERARQVTPGAALSRQQIEQYLTTEKTSAARLASAQAAIQLQQVRLDQTRIVAPDSGVISARSATLGAVVNPGQELFRLIRQNRLEWRAELMAAEGAAIAVGQSVRVLRPDGSSLMGKVRALAPTADAQSRKTWVYVDLPTPAALRPGDFVRGEFELGQRPGLTLPPQTLVVRDGGHYVFELGALERGGGSKVIQRRVQLGQRLADRVEIVSGLQPGAKVVAQGAGFLNDGDLVRVAPTQP